jgi:hypothetical protein
MAGIKHYLETYQAVLGNELVRQSGVNCFMCGDITRLSYQPIPPTHLGKAIEFINNHRYMNQIQVLERDLNNIQANLDFTFKEFREKMHRAKNLVEFGRYQGQVPQQFTSHQRAPRDYRFDLSDMMTTSNRVPGPSRGRMVYCFTEDEGHDGPVHTVQPSTNEARKEQPTVNHNVDTPQTQPQSSSVKDQASKEIQSAALPMQVSSTASSGLMPANPFVAPPTQPPAQKPAVFGPLFSKQADQKITSTQGSLFQPNFTKPASPQRPQEVEVKSANSNITSRGVPIPSDHLHLINVKGCGCQKVMCLNRQCGCRKQDLMCSDLCRCAGCHNMYSPERAAERLGERITITASQVTSNLSGDGVSIQTGLFTRTVSMPVQTPTVTEESPDLNQQPKKLFFGFPQTSMFQSQPANDKCQPGVSNAEQKAEQPPPKTCSPPEENKAANKEIQAPMSCANRQGDSSEPKDREGSGLPKPISPGNASESFREVSSRVSRLSEKEKEEEPQVQISYLEESHIQTPAFPSIIEEDSVAICYDAIGGEESRLG